MPELAIVMPSNRPLATSRESIETALIFAEKTGSTVIVSDNSGDPDKRAQFDGASPNLVYLHSPGVSSIDNLMCGLDVVSTPFVIAMGDDDAIYRLDGASAIDLSALPDDVVGVRPRAMLWTAAEGVQAVDDLALTATTADERFLTYNRNAKKVNNLYFGYYRTEVFRGLFRFFRDHHPTRGGYCDWALISTLVCCGRVLVDPSAIYRYDLGRWSSNTGIEKANIDSYRGAGLSDVAIRYDALLRLVDIFVMLSLGSLPLPKQERRYAQWANARMGLMSFIASYRESPHLFSTSVERSIPFLMTMPEAEAAFHAVLPLLDELRPGLAADYERFYAAAMAN